jgi:hypothetical protein
LFIADLARTNYRFEGADSVVRARIVQAVHEHKRLIDALFEQHDCEALRSCLAELERAVRDARSGGDGTNHPCRLLKRPADCLTPSR